MVKVLTEFDKHKSAIPLFIKEIESDLKELKKSVAKKEFEIAKHYSSGINQLSKWITDILEIYK